MIQYSFKVSDAMYTVGRSNGRFCLGGSCSLSISIPLEDIIFNEKMESVESKDGYFSLLLDKEYTKVKRFITE